MLCGRSDSALSMTIGFGLIGIQIVAMVYMTVKVLLFVLPADSKVMLNKKRFPIRERSPTLAI